MLELVDKLGGWPTLQGDKWKEDKFTWHAVDGIYLNYNSYLNII